MLIMKSIITNSWSKLFSCTICNDFTISKSDVLSGIPKRKLSSDPNDENQKEKNINKILPPEPEHCCMSGCANCVWVKYAEQVAKAIGNGGDVAKAKIFEHVKDPNLRAFLMVELDDIFRKKKS